MLSQKSLRLFFVSEMLQAFWLGHFISIVFFHAMTMTDFHISVFHAIMAASMFFLDIPTGVFADKYGAKKSLVLANVALSLAFFSYVLSFFTSYWVAIIGSALLFSLYDGFHSGASEAYVFRVHKKHGQESSYLPYMSRLHASASVTTAIASVIGGYLYIVHPAIPYTVQGLLMVVAIAVSTKLENVHTPPVHTISLKTQLRECLRLVKSGNGFVWATFLLISGTATYEIFNNLINQSYWLETGISVEKFGWLGLVVFLMDGILVRQTPTLSKWLGKWIWQWIGIAITIVGILAHFYTSFVAVAILSGFLSGIFSVSRRVFDQYVQERVDTESLRASFFSFLNTIANLAIRGTFFLVVFLVAAHGYRETLFLLCVGFGGITVLLWFAGLWSSVGKSVPETLAVES